MSFFDENETYFILLHNIIMATPIKITPTLRGKQSYNFNVKIAETSINRETKETKERISTIVEKVLLKKNSK